MNLQEHYDNLYKAAVAEISVDNYEIDPLINSDKDDRFGLSLIIRPSIAVKNEIQKFLAELSSVEPKQYYYLYSDIHITVISIISCYSGLKLGRIKVSEYIELIKKVLKNQERITISCKGITASPSCLMIQGFINDSSLNHLRGNLRETFKNSDLDQSMDARYLIKTAHATVFRFQDELEQKEKFLEILENYRDYNFGVFEVDDIELVYNNWYHQAHRVSRLFNFKMKNEVSKK